MSSMAEKEKGEKKQNLIKDQKVMLQDTNT